MTILVESVVIQEFFRIFAVGIINARRHIVVTKHKPRINRSFRIRVNNFVAFQQFHSFIRRNNLNAAGLFEQLADFFRTDAFQSIRVPSIARKTDNCIHSGIYQHFDQFCMISFNGKDNKGNLAGTEGGHIRLSLKKHFYSLNVALFNSLHQWSVSCFVSFVDIRSGTQELLNGICMWQSRV